MLEHLGINLSFALFRKYFRPEELETYSAAEIAALGQIYRKWELMALPFLLVYTVATTYLWYEVLSLVGDLSAHTLPACVYLDVPHSIVWLLPALFLGMISSAVPMHFTYKAMLGDRYDEYTLWINLKSGFDGWKAFKLIAVLIALGSAVLVEAEMRLWDAFQEDRVVMMRPWFWSSRTYLYSEVKAIAQFARFQAPNGNVQKIPYNAIRFKDGTTWSTRNQLSRTDEQRNAAIISLVSSGSGRPVQQLDLISDW